MNKLTETVNKGCFLVSILGGTTSVTILIIIIGLLKSCFGEKIDPLDDSYMTKREMFSRKCITDSTGVGFELLWYTTNPVTKKRMEEIRTRDQIYQAQKQLCNQAANHFKHDFFNIDIYNFAKYAKRFDVDTDVRLVNIFVYGLRLKKQYWQPNPTLPSGGCTEPAHNTEQGILYLEECDIYVTNPDAGRRYRYWECWRTSSTDERYTHFTWPERNPGK